MATEIARLQEQKKKHLRRGKAALVIGVLTGLPAIALSPEVHYLLAPAIQIPNPQIYGIPLWGPLDMIAVSSLFLALENGERVVSLNKQLKNLQG